MATTPTSIEKGKSVLKQFAKLKAVRDPLDKEYQDCYRYTYPTLGVGFNQTLDGDGITAASTTRAQTAQLFDSTGTDAVRLLSSSVLSSLTPPNTLWFNLADAMSDEEELDQDGKEWLEDSAERIHSLIHGSNYDTEALEFCMHQMIAGMAGLYVELKSDNDQDGDDSSRQRFRFETWPLNHLYCQETLNRGYIDTVYRQFWYTVAEAAAEFGIDALPEKLRERFAEEPHCPKLHRFIVCIRPRLTTNKKLSKGKTKKNLPWESLWVCAESGHIVRESGFHEMPVIVPRWLRIPDTDYARGPVFDALPDIKSLNKVKETMHTNMDLHVSGMFKIKENSFINPHTFRFGPRRTITVNDMDDIQPLSSGGDIQFAMNEVASLQAQIRRMLLADQLGPTEKSIMTATEVTTRNNQVRQILGPIFARLQSEYLTHLVTRCFGLAFRAGMLPPPPASLAGRDFDIVYRSPLARSQKMQELEAIDAYSQRMQVVAQAQPLVLDYVNFDAIAKKIGDLLGIDPEIQNDEKAVRKIRHERKKQQDAANQQALQMAQADALAKQKPAQEAASPEVSLEA